MLILFHKSGCSTQDAQSVLNEDTLTSDNMAKKKKKKGALQSFQKETLREH